VKPVSPWSIERSTAESVFKEYLFYSSTVQPLWWVIGGWVENYARVSGRLDFRRREEIR